MWSHGLCRFYSPNRSKIQLFCLKVLSNKFQGGLKSVPVDRYSIGVAALENVFCIFIQPSSCIQYKSISGRYRQNQQELHYKQAKRCSWFAAINLFCFSYNTCRWVDGHGRQFPQLFFTWINSGQQKHKSRLLFKINLFQMWDKKNKQSTTQIN